MLVLLPLFAPKRQEFLGEIDKLPLEEKTHLLLKGVISGMYFHREHMIMVFAKAHVEMQEIKHEFRLEGSECIKAWSFLQQCRLYLAQLAFTGVETMSILM